jgi:cbb3-type cytochrome oxidase subunit 1
MNRLTMFWNATLFGRNEPLYVIRILGILTFVGILGMLGARELHYTSLCDFLAGMSVASSGMLIVQAFGLSFAEYKCDPHASEAIELHLARRSQ